MLPKVTIADSAFMPFGKSESLNGDNVGIGPTHFEWEQADPQEARFVTDGFIKHARGKGQVAWLSESFFLHPENYLMAMEKPFDYVLTHNQNFVTNKNWLWVPHGGSWIAFDQWGIHKKTKNVSIILSDKKSMRGHQLRHEVVEKFGDRFDGIFGLDGFTRKFDCLADFRFSVVIESEKTPYFFSEKLIDCLSVGTIPIYWGSPIDTPRELAIMEADNIADIETRLSEANEEFYNNILFYNYALPRFDQNLSFAKQFRISEDWIWNHHPFLFQGHLK